MRGLRFRRPSPALIVAVVALVAALAGTAIADPTANTAAKPVTKKKAKKIAKKQVNKVLPISSENLGDSTVSAAKLGSISETSATTTATVAPPISATATCPAGTKVVSGGVSLSAPAASVVAGSSRTDNGWTASAIATAPGQSVTAHAYCLDA